MLFIVNMNKERFRNGIEEGALGLFVSRWTSMSSREKLAPIPKESIALERWSYIR